MRPDRKNDDSLPGGFHAPVTLRRRLWWLALALVPSALLMGVTAHLSVDIAVGAVAVGHSAGAVSALVHHGLRPLADLEVALAAADLPGRGARRRGGHGLRRRAGNPGIVGVGALHLAAFFLTALVCHGAMAADRPASKHLTEYYLWMSAGGVVGGLLCALVAPLVFNSVMEYPLMLVAACLLRPPPRSSRYERFWRWSDLALMLMQGCVFAFAVCALCAGRLADVAANWSSESLKTFALAITNAKAKICWVVAAGVLAFLLQRRRALVCRRRRDAPAGVCMICGDRENVIYSARSFFGVLRVEVGHYDRDDDCVDCHTLMHGSTMHGEQSRDARRRPRSLDLLPSHRTGGRRLRRPGRARRLSSATATSASWAWGPAPSPPTPSRGSRSPISRSTRPCGGSPQDPNYFTYLTNCSVTPRDPHGRCPADARPASPTASSTCC